MTGGGESSLSLNFLFCPARCSDVIDARADRLGVAFLVTILPLRSLGLCCCDGVRRSRGGDCILANMLVWAFAVSFGGMDFGIRRTAGILPFERIALVGTDDGRAIVAGPPDLANRLPAPRPRRSFAGLTPRACRAAVWKNNVGLDYRSTFFASAPLACRTYLRLCSTGGIQRKGRTWPRNPKWCPSFRPGCDQPSEC